MGPEPAEAVVVFSVLERAEEKPGGGCWEGGGEKGEFAVEMEELRVGLRLKGLLVVVAALVGDQGFRGLCEELPGRAAEEAKVVDNGARPWLDVLFCDGEDVEFEDHTVEELRNDVAVDDERSVAECESGCGEVI